MKSDSIKNARETANRLVTNIKKVIVGNDDAIYMVVAALLCKGHVLIEGGSPGVTEAYYPEAVVSVIHAQKKI